LQDLFSPLMLKIDIDVWRFSTLFTDKARKKKVDLIWIHRGNAETEAHHRISRGTPSLAEYAPTASEADDVIATLTGRALVTGGEVFIVTGDRDAFQLVNDQVTVL
jgi:hypothetical protein